ncbi:MAG: RQC domain protein [Ignavibacteriae bacterium]|nr:MAG: RQC domain protein [Ignavibacteriota bacterium]
MGKKVNRVKYYLNSKNINTLPDNEIKVILRAADSLVCKGGRTLLAKILKGSKEKKVLEFKLDENPSYGYFKDLKPDDVLAKIDWMIENHYIRIEYDWKLPLISFTDKGWEIERDLYAGELLEKLKIASRNCEYAFVHELRDRNRGMILLLLDKIKSTGDKRWIGILEEWKKNDYKKVQRAISEVIEYLSK